MKKYDNVFVGGGISAMIAAGYLAQAGQKTLIIEKKDKLGGRIGITKFKNIFGQDQGPTHWSWLNGGFWFNAARDFGCNIKYTYYPQISVYIKDSKNPPKAQPVYCTAEAFTEYVMSQMQPDVPANTRQEFLKIFKEMLNCTYEEFCKTETILLKDWVEARTTNPVVLNYLVKYVSMQCMLEFDRAMKLCSAMSCIASIRFWSCGEGFLTIMNPDPETGFAQEFAKAIQRLGCEVILSSEVDEVIVENGTATGVRLANGDVIEGRRVIVNAIFSQVAKLFKEVPADVEKAIKAMDQVQLMDFYIFYRLRSNPFTEEGVIQIIDEKGDNYGCISTQSTYMPWSIGEDPECKHMTVYTAVYPKTVGKTMDEAIEEALELQEDCFPGFKDAYIDAKGISHYPLWHHPYVLDRINIESPSVKGLYFVGDSTTPQVGMGLDAACSTGVFLAEKLLNKTIMPFTARK
jgi:hypothetical protein